jgi:hypothetical protein
MRIDSFIVGFAGETDPTAGARPNNAAPAFSCWRRLAISLFRADSFRKSSVQPWARDAAA